MAHMTDTQPQVKHESGKPDGDRHHQKLVIVETRVSENQGQQKSEENDQRYRQRSVQVAFTPLQMTPQQSQSTQERHRVRG